MKTIFDFEKLSLTGIVQKRIAIENLELPEDSLVNFDIDIGIESLTDTENDTLLLIYYVKIYEEGEGKYLFGEFEIEFYFAYQGLTNQVTISNDQKVLATELAKEANIVAYSTTRGIIAVETRGTMLEKLILPLMTAETLLSNSTKDI